MENIKDIDIRKLELNKGQIEGLPKNPRMWDKEDVERLAASIEQTPELLECRPLIVAPHKKKYVVLGGNMRLEALKHLKRNECPCIVMGGLSLGKMKEIVLKDNSSFGDWDADELANGWDDLPLGDWGVKVTGMVTEVGDFENQELDVEEWEENMSMNFRLEHDEMERVKSYFADKDPRMELLRLTGYEQD